MNKKTSNILSEAKSDLELAIVKSLCKAPLSPIELDEVLSISETNLLKDHDLDLYMTQQIKWHAKNEQFRLRAQNLYTPVADDDYLYPEKPYTRTDPIDESSVSKVSKRQLRRIIREESARLTEAAPFPVTSRVHPDFAAAIRGETDKIDDDMRDLLSLVAVAEGKAKEINAKMANVEYGQNAGGREADDLGAALHKVWISLGMDAEDMF